MSRLNSLGLTVFTAIILQTIAGCAPLQISKPNIWPFSSEDAPGMPNRIVAAWSDTVLHQTDKVPMRGFGGRLIFYKAEKPEPIKVDGTLTVYVFDETDRDPNNLKPHRKYVFTKDQIPSHYSKSKLGHSYSFWIPWDEAGGPQKELGIIVRFTPEKGGVVVGEQTQHILPGKTQLMANNPGIGASPYATPPATTGQSPFAQTGSVERTSFVTPLPPLGSAQAAMQNGMNQNSGITTATIDLPPQSSLRNMSMIGAGTMGIGAAPVAPVAGNNLPAAYPQTAAANSGNANSSQEPQPTVQPNRFVHYQHRVPSEPTARPNRDREPWQQRPLGSPYFPVPPQKPVTTNAPQPSVVNGGTLQN
jgi:hypothetical protein